MPWRSQEADQALAAALRRLRTESGLSQGALAGKAGITLRSYARIELGHASPAWATVRRIAKALDVSPSELGEAIEAQK